jgi:phenylalanyl-tRNA synthetase beta chain
MRVPLEWLREFVDIRIRPEGLARLLTMGGLEVEAIEGRGRHAIFEIGVTPNRGDCLSITGIAREVAALAASRLTLPAVKAPKGEGSLRGRLAVAIRKRGRCRRYTARIIDGVRVGPSPSWMVGRLTACGIRSVNNVVDATNYVMLETGQPLHAFDVAKLRGGRVSIASAEEGTRFLAIDGQERLLAADDLAICDAEGVIALAGVMGGKGSEVGDETTSVLLESACFDAAGVRRTSKRHGLSSESSRRFERGVDPNGVAAALHRLTACIVETAGGRPSDGWVDLYPREAKPARIALASDEVRRILGIDLSGAQIAKLLARLGLSASIKRGGDIAVTVPTIRADLMRPIDLIEEIARLHGYDAIPESVPVVRMGALSRPRFAREEEIARSALFGMGLSESVVYGFTSEEALAPFAELGPTPVRIANPLSNEQGVMSTTLVPGLLDAAKLNASRQRTDLRLFALQRIYHRPAGVGPSDEPRSLAGILMGRRTPGAWERAQEMMDFYDAKGAVEALVEALGLAGAVAFHAGEPYAFLHPGRFASVLCGGSRVGFVGQLHPDVALRWGLEQEVYAFELHFELLAEHAEANVHRFQELSRFPFVTRDIAIVIEERIPLVEVEKVIADCHVEMLDGVTLFDVWRGRGIPEGRKSLALTLRFSRNDRTLTDAEVQEVSESIVGALASKLGAVLRT